MIFCFGICKLKFKDFYSNLSYLIFCIGLKIDFFLLMKKFVEINDCLIIFVVELYWVLDIVIIRLLFKYRIIFKLFFF